MKKNNNISAIDLFCGIGGLSYGLKAAGIDIKAGIDIDITCKYAFEENCRTVFINEDIKNIQGAFLKSFYGKDDVKVLVGCAPCQPLINIPMKMAYIIHVLLLLQATN